MKQLFEFFPLIVFFAVYYKSDKDLYFSIAAVIIATLISLIALYVKERKISTMMLVSTVILVIFGGLSLFFKNEIRELTSESVILLSISGCVKFFIFILSIYYFYSY